MLRIDVVIQARMGATRLPGKVMLEVLGKPVIWRVISRVSKAQLIDGLVVATTTKSEDDVIETFCRKNDISFFRGSDEDVLDRYYQCAKKHDLENIVRITADCPLHDPHVIDLVIKKYKSGNYDYISNTDPPSYPDGIDVEIFSLYALEKAWTNATLSSEREHVTPYIRKNKNLFRVGNVQKETDLSELRWTLDQEEDFRFIQTVYEKLSGSKNDIFYIDDILELIDKFPELLNINSNLKRNEGYLKSLKNDMVIDL
jgi:spore coat polysaccharide biosynthesis protein SpsF (cytidylyltransferase family)